MLTHTAKGSPQGLEVKKLLSLISVQMDESGQWHTWTWVKAPARP